MKRKMLSVLLILLLAIQCCPISTVKASRKKLPITTKSYELKKAYRYHF